MSRWRNPKQPKRRGGAPIASFATNARPGRPRTTGGRAATVAFAFAVALGSAGMLGVLGCGEPSPEAQLAEAREDMERARKEVASAQARYDEATRELEKAQARRDEAAQALDQARSQLEDARTRMGRFATDDAIFRAVQGSLLQDDRLGETAIPVRVDQGVVTLTGTVEDPKLAERAEKLAREVAGVVDVRNRIEVRREGGASAQGGDEGGAAPEGRASDQPEE